MHIACLALVHHLRLGALGDDSSVICKYLIDKCPESVRIPDNGGCLPIHYLLRHCQHRPVKEVVVCLLREYPDSYDMGTKPDPDDGDVLVPSSIPFIQRIKPLLDEERELKENIVHLPEVSGVFQDAVDGTDNTSPSALLTSAACDIFSDWATITFVERLEARMEQILTDLQDECNVEAEQDSEDETDE